MENRTFGFDPTTSHPSDWEALGIMLADCGVDDASIREDVIAAVKNHIEATQADGVATITGYKPRNWQQMRAAQVGNVEIFFVSDIDLQIVVNPWKGG